MFLLLQLLVIVLGYISHEHEAMAAYVPPPYTSIVVPVNKHTDAAKPLYSVEIMTAYDYVNDQYLHSNFLIDIDAPFIWHDCIVQWNIYPGSCPTNTLCTYAVSCVDYQCTTFRTSYSYKNPSCPLETNTSSFPGWGDCTCSVNVFNPVTGSCNQTLINYDDFTVNVSDGRKIFSGLYDAHPYAACAPHSTFASFPSNVSGVMAFSSSPYAFPAYFYQPLKKTLALCLPSKPSVPGVLFFGTGPYYLLPQSNVDVRSYLSYTPLVTQPDSFGYFISVDSIVIKKRSINVPANTSTKLSTTDPYTTLRTNIYNGVVRRFTKVTKQLRPAKPVSPFGLCFSTSTAGLKVPDIDFSLPDGKKWTVSTANSIKQITNEVACLAFVDGGATSEPAIVIGTFQFEDNFLEFDLENSTFGFSSSLLRKQTSCANFNFTLTDGP
ncbi:putative aspartic peptidase A1 family, aspartic peptidase domain superfamily, xylanase inhibitor [Helianthus annuus]|uniref:Aspartic peptidase A1 family, aspartic peptidase domain superfamily, xylanase inhibitor n=1 Tax=Helianthus annuus TaxID=4232 RepID=A0A251TRF2_HELAN|nr:putative aspartic peptidase A1 family, aspartic peptidase domain superfamily, xylanase inhibitor [Helianthus annuus]